MRMQSAVTREGRYETFNAKRVLVRQGHKADTYYFILSGSGKKRTKDPPHTKCQCQSASVLQQR